MDPTEDGWFDLRTIDGSAKFAMRCTLHRARYGAAHYEVRRGEDGKPAFARMATGAALDAMVARKQKQAGFKARVEALRRGKRAAK